MTFCEYELIDLSIEFLESVHQQDLQNFMNKYKNVLLQFHH
jgi:hypothetical protein